MNTRADKIVHDTDTVASRSQALNPADSCSYIENEQRLKEMRRVISIGFRAIEKVRSEIARCDIELDVLTREITRLELATDAYVDIANSLKQTVADENENNDTPTPEHRDKFMYDYIELKAAIEEYNNILSDKRHLENRYERLKGTELTRIQRIHSTELTLSEQRAMIEKLEALKLALETILSPAPNSNHLDEL